MFATWCAFSAGFTGTAMPPAHGHGEQRRQGLRAFVQVHRDALARGEAVLVQPAPGAQDVVRQDQCPRRVSRALASRRACAALTPAGCRETE